MQIEFYLPLPSEGFWPALIIYYIAGLLVFPPYTLKYALDKGMAKSLSGIKLKAIYWLAIGAALWPLAPFSYYRNRWRDDMQSLKRGAGQK